MVTRNDYDVKLPLFGLPKLWPYVKGYRGIILFNVLCGAASSLIDSIYPLFNRYALDHFAALHTTDTLMMFIALFIAVVIVQVILNYISTYYCGKVEMEVDRDLRNSSFEHLQRMSFSYYNQNNVGYIHARVISDTGKIGEMIAWRLMDIVWMGSYLVFIIVVMLRIDLKLAGYVLTIVPVAVLLITLFQRKLIVLNRRIRETNARITGDFNEGITGAAAIKTLVIEDRINHGFTSDTAEMEHVSVRTAHYSALFTAVVTLMSSLTLAIVMYNGGHMTMDGVMRIGTLSVFMNYAINMIQPIQGLIMTISAMISIQVNIERFTRLMETEPGVSDRPEVIEKYGDIFDAKTENWEELTGDIEFRDVTFRYPDGTENVLEHFNLNVPYGTNIAIVGETGAGKSTLVNLVCRFYEPTDGQILLDGRDLRERSQLWLHRNISYVLQTPHLFSGTVRDNLRYGNPEASDEQIMAALHLVAAEEVIAKMPAGLDSEVGEDGGLLSTGEKQLLSFARAILADPRILILDEATASVDTITEKKIQNAIDQVIRGRTSFVIAHRLSTIVNADVILVVQDGRIIERGKHGELMRKKGAYYALYMRQYEDMLVDTI
ncbi:MAG: ABC transporter ATP-binding protein [Solobacterium sp.]|nr:ABC transporter ATP-binding protein [Solobacterium sp.]